MREEDVKDFQAFLQEFQSETDRGAALVGAALIDLRLTETLRAFMVSNNAADELLEGPTAPLSSFSSRIAASFALGLIDAHEKHECHTIRKVRNEFAHRAHGTTFKDSAITKLCDDLKSNLPGDKSMYTDNPRFIFVNAVILVSLALTYRSQWVAKEKRVTKRWPYD
jgi:mannitol operon repressor